MLVAAALVAFNALTRIVRHLYYRFHVPHEVRSSAHSQTNFQTFSEFPRPVLSNIFHPLSPQVRLLSPHQLRLLHLDPKLSRVEGKEATSSPSVMSPRVARLPRLATLSNSSDLKWWVIVLPVEQLLADATSLIYSPLHFDPPRRPLRFSIDFRRRPPQMSPDNSLSQSVLYQSERSFTSLNDTSFTLNSSGFVDTSFNTDRSGAFSPLCKCTWNVRGDSKHNSLPTHPTQPP